MATKEKSTQDPVIYSSSFVASLIDHTLLKPEARTQDVRNLCQEAKKHSFFSVCINPSYIPLAKEELKNSSVKVCTVVGFPLGAMTTKAKVFETKDAITAGADEIDMVLNIGALKSQNYDLVIDDIGAVVGSAQGRFVKVILETCLLSDTEILKACELAVEAGAAFVKTSTGFSNGGATEHAVSLMHSSVNGKALVKASGGVKTLNALKSMYNLGARRIGTSSGVKILEETQSRN